MYMFIEKYVHLYSFHGEKFDRQMCFTYSQFRKQYKTGNVTADEALSMAVCLIFLVLSEIKFPNYCILN